MTRRQKVKLQRERYKLSSVEYKIALAIAKMIVVILAILAYLLRFIFIALFKSKRWLYRFSIAILITYSALNTLNTAVYAPYANATEFPVVAKPLTQHDQIVNYIHEVFKEDADKAFLVLSCENHALNPNAVNTAKNIPVGSRDIGVFQINEYWQKVQGKFLFNWKVNIEVAHQLYEENGSFKLWSCGKRLGV